MVKRRCDWCCKDQLYIDYHDNEWGIPVYDDNKLFEYLILESFQSGLSWYTILKKRENFRQAFDGFDPSKISKYSNNKVQHLLKDSGIIRSKAKIIASINNAEVYLKTKKEFGSFSNYVWQFTNKEIIYLRPDSLDDILTKTSYSEAMAKDMKARGFKYIGSTTCMAYMEAIGMINHHLSYCFKSEVRNEKKQ